MMCSTREKDRQGKLRRAVTSAAMGLTLSVALVGCQHQANVRSPFKFQHNSRPEPGDTEVVTNDEAQLSRVWERSHVEYANMSTVAGPIGDPIQPQDDMPDYQRAAAEPALFVVNTLLSPVIYVMYPPWSEVTYRGDAYAPTHTGNGFAQIAGNAGGNGAQGGYSGYETGAGNTNDMNGPAGGAMTPAEPGTIQPNANGSAGTGTGTGTGESGSGAAGTTGGGNAGAAGGINSNAPSGAGTGGSGGAGGGGH